MMTGNCSSRSSIDSAIWAAKLFVLSVGIISTLLSVKVVIIPFMFTFLLSSVPTIWMWITSWLCPPYIYILANLIIISVAASSTFFHHHYHIQHHESEDGPKPEPEPELDDDNHHQTSTTSDATLEFTSTISGGFMSRDIKIVKDDFNLLVNESTTATTDLSSPKLLSKVTSLACLKDSDFPEEEDTLDGMWKTIMEGKEKQAKKQLKKTETWKEQVVDVAVGDGRDMRKSETYRERSESKSLLRREMGPCSEELNKKVEAFIKKINNEMRLQRLESDQRFNDMVNRGL